MRLLRLTMALLIAGILAGAFVPLTSAAGVDIYLEPIDSVSGVSITDACFVLQNYSNEGCDENGDGQISFAAVPPGQYTIVQTQSAAGYADTAPLTITVDASPASQVFSVPLQASTSGNGALVYLRVEDMTTGNKVTSSCFVLVDFSNIGCDENADGKISFENVPAGIYTVHQAQPSAGFLMVKDFRINVHADLAVQTFPIELTPVGSATGSVDVAVVPYDGTTGGGLTGACVQFEGGSLVGCDDNGDGRIDFKGLPVGTYQLVETQAPAGYALASPHFVSVTQSGRIYYLEHFPDNQAQPFSNVDVALVTRDPDSGDLLMGACYIILDASVEGCDENSDGQVDYKGVAPGTYTVHQTKAPNGFNLINDFNIQISQFDPTQSILIKQAPEQFTPGHRNVSVAVWDIDTGQRITGPDICVQLAEWSNVGCDTNSDGQIDFQDVPVGTYPINVISLPDGYRVHFATNKVVVEESNPFSIANALLTVEGT